jgi:hypothetical protein
VTALGVEHAVVVAVVVDAAAVVEAVAVVGLFQVLVGQHGVDKLHLSWEACHLTMMKQEKVVTGDPFELELGSTSGAARDSSTKLQLC